MFHNPGGHDCILGGGHIQMNRNIFFAVLQMEKYLSKCIVSSEIFPMDARLQVNPPSIEHFEVMRGWILLEVRPTLVVEDTMFCFHQEMNGSDSQRTPKKVVELFRYSGCFGVRSVGPVGNFLDSHFSSRCWISAYQPPKFNSEFTPEKVTSFPNRRGSSSNHHFSGASC